MRISLRSFLRCQASEVLWYLVHSGYDAYRPVLARASSATRDASMTSACHRAKLTLLLLRIWRVPPEAQQSCEFVSSLRAAIYVSHHILARECALVVAGPG